MEAPKAETRLRLRALHDSPPALLRAGTPEIRGSAIMERDFAEWASYDCF